MMRYNIRAFHRTTRPEHNNNTTLRINRRGHLAPEIVVAPTVPDIVRTQAHLHNPMH